MTPETRIHELITLWQQRRAQGMVTSAEELCRDAPELIPAVRERLRLLESTAVPEVVRNGTQRADGLEKEARAEVSPDSLAGASATPVPGRVGAFLGAMGSALEILPSSNDYLPEEDDVQALQRDWETVASDLWAALDELQPKAQ